MSIVHYFQNTDILSVLELAVALLLLRGLYKNSRFGIEDRSLLKDVKRGEKALKIIRNSYVGFITLFALPILTLDYSYDQYKLIILIFNTGTFTYLFFFNGWFRNKVIGIYGKFETYIERH